MANKGATGHSIQIEKFIRDWNGDFPDHQLTVEDFKKSHSVMGALFQIFNRLGMDLDAVLMPPLEKDLNEHIIYYWDLLPVINMTRVTNHVLSIVPQKYMITVDYLLQPTAQTSYPLLLFMLNLIAFYEQRLQSIAPYEDELFKFTNMVKALEEKRDNLFQMLNRQAQEKGKRADRVEQMHQEIRQLEEEIRQEEQARDDEKQQLDAIIKENNNTDVIIDQKRATKEGLLAERDRKKALRVYDAEDIRTQAAQAAQDVQEAEEKLNSLKATIAQKEASLQILQTIKPNLDTANNLLHEISKLKEYEMGDLEEESKEGELAVARTELAELGAARGELAARRGEGGARRQHAATARQRERHALDSAVREAEDKDKKRREFTTLAAKRTQEIKEQTTQYSEEKEKGFNTIKQMKEEHDSVVKAWEEALIKLVTDVKADINKKLSIAD